MKILTTAEMMEICTSFGSRFDKLKKLLQRGVIGGRSAHYKLIDVAYTECPDLHKTPEYKKLIGVK